MLFARLEVFLCNKRLNVFMCKRGWITSQLKQLTQKQQQLTTTTIL